MNIQYSNNKPHTLRMSKTRILCLFLLIPMAIMYPQKTKKKKTFIPPPPEIKESYCSIPRVDISIELPINDSLKNTNYIFLQGETDKRAEYLGGIPAFKKEFISKFQIPTELTETTNKILLIVKITIEKDGLIGDIQVLRHPGLTTVTESVRVIKEMEAWQPALIDNKAVRSYYTIPIQIKY